MEVLLGERQKPFEICDALLQPRGLLFVILHGAKYAAGPGYGSSPHSDWRWASKASTSAGGIGAALVMRPHFEQRQRGAPVFGSGCVRAR